MGKKIVQSRARELLMPFAVSVRYKKYCELTKLNYTEHLRVLVLNAVREMDDVKKLSAIVEKMKNRNPHEETVTYNLRLPQEAVDIINYRCKGLRLYGYRCYFLYYLIEDELQKVIEGALGDEG